MLATLSSCSAPTEEVMVGGKPRRMKKSISSQFEWAVQSYEAGSYKEAIQRFERLQKEGSEVPEYDLILFYLGMSHHKIGEYPRAAGELEAFLKAGSQRQEGQDARLTLLLCYEKLGRWKDSASLSAETDKLTLFQYNRALLKLLWARALAEQGEVQGAKVVLEDAVAYLDKVGSEEKAIPFYANPDEDLWGRYHFSSVLMEARTCPSPQPKEIAKKKKLYVPWLESVTDCLRASLTHGSQELFVKENAWSDMAGTELGAAIDTFGQKIQTHLKKEASSLASHRALQKSASENLYRLLGTVDEHIKNFKNRGVSPKPLESLRKQIDRLLVVISSPS